MKYSAHVKKAINRLATKAKQELMIISIPATVKGVLLCIVTAIIGIAKLLYSFWQE
jgi:hypothetical protein